MLSSKCYIMIVGKTSAIKGEGRKNIAVQLSVSYLKIKIVLENVIVTQAFVIIL